jgi:hypothetical protein
MAICLPGILVLGVSLAVRSGKHKENPAIAGEATIPSSFTPAQPYAEVQLS